MVSSRSYTTSFINILPQIMIIGRERNNRLLRIFKLSGNTWPHDESTLETGKISEIGFSAKHVLLSLILKSEFIYFKLYTLNFHISALLSFLTASNRFKTLKNLLKNISYHRKSIVPNSLLSYIPIEIISFTPTITFTCQLVDRRPWNAELSKWTTLFLFLVKTLPHILFKISECWWVLIKLLKPF